MKYEEILASLQQASGFELFRLRAMLDKVLDDPKWIHAIRSRLQPGQKITFFDPESNREHAAAIVELLRKEVVVEIESFRAFLI